VTVEEVASLKRVGKGSTLLLLDGRGGQAKAVAKALARKGFRRAFVVSGGFKGAPGRPGLLVVDTTWTLWCCSQASTARCG
jgi:rhodanese-related sulfurtransferase